MSPVRRAFTATGLIHAFSTLLLLVLTACAEGEPMERVDAGGTTAKVDHCGGACTEVELCVEDKEGKYGCARICANQLRCWSGCCLPLGDTGYNVCRPNNYCFAE
jgi:hypothetical protein